MVALLSVLPLLATGLAVAEASGFLSRAKTCETADAYCVTLAGAGSKCVVERHNRGTCKGASDIPCRCVGVTEYNKDIIRDLTTTVAPANTTAVPLTTTAPPANTTAVPVTTTTQAPATTEAPTSSANSTSTSTTPAPSSNATTNSTTHEPVTTSTTTTTTPVPTTTNTTSTTTTTTSPATTTTTPAPTSETLTTSAAPAQAPNCVNLPATAEPMTLWVEWPAQIGTDVSDFQNLFTKIVSYVDENCANLKTTKLVLRTSTPNFPAGNADDQKAFWPPASSPLYSHLLSKLPSSVEVHFYPYVADATSEAAWTTFGGSSSLLTNIYSFTKQWNEYLSSVGGHLVKGVVMDNEEIRNWSNASEIISAGNVDAAKGSLEFGLTIGFDETGSIGNWASFVDEFYLQVYDLYTPTASIDSTSDSRFLTLNGDATSMASYIADQVLTANIWNVYNLNASQITLMWSNQSLGKDCLYPLDNGLCGVNNEFGSWSPADFNAFLVAFDQQMAAKIDNSAQIEQALFQFSFVASNWFSA